MSRVAANQDRSSALRSKYVYHQHIHVAARKTNGKLMCGETMDYRVVPAPQGSKRKLQRLTGRYWHKGRYVSFSQQPNHKNENESIDCDVAYGLGTGLTGGHSRDGIDQDLFPLTTDQQKKFRFAFLGDEVLAGHAVYRITFRPKQKKDYDWSGEADVDMQAFQPVDVFTKLSRKLPVVVRAFLVSLPGLGFSVQYQREPGGVWFPESFGTEFRLRAVMFYKREYTISLENSGFERTHVETRIELPPPN